MSKRGAALLALGIWQQEHHPKAPRIAAIDAAQKKPKPEKKQVYEVPVHTDMEEKELEGFMKKKPSHQARVK